jgi:hypothetical protein
MKTTVFNLLFLTAGILSVAAVLTLVPLMRRFEKEGQKVDFDFYSLRAGLWLVRPSLLPSHMEPLGRKIRVYSILLLWPAFALMCIAWFIDQ